MPKGEFRRLIGDSAPGDRYTSSPAYLGSRSIADVSGGVSGK